MNKVRLYYLLTLPLEIQIFLRKSNILYDLVNFDTSGPHNAVFFNSFRLRIGNKIRFGISKRIKEMFPLMYPLFFLSQKTVPLRGEGQRVTVPTVT